MPFQVNDRVRVSVARGNWVGYVIDVRYGANYPEYLVRAHLDDYGEVYVIEPELALEGSGPSFEVGQYVTIAGMPCEILEKTGNTFKLRAQVRHLDKNLTLVRELTPVPYWRLAIEQPIV
jgi:hypothetical protein